VITHRRPRARPRMPNPSAIPPSRKRPKNAKRAHAQECGGSGEGSKTTQVVRPSRFLPPRECGRTVAQRGLFARELRFASMSLERPCNCIELVARPPWRVASAVSRYEVPVPLLSEVIGDDRFEPREMAGAVFAAGPKSPFLAEVAQAFENRILRCASGGVDHIHYGPVCGIDAFLVVR
jgi:hypothetical protein